jgi:metal-sulfur cluster biosynthetic enzyme
LPAVSSEVSRAAVYSALGGVVDPCSIATGVPISLLDMGLVEDIRLEEGEVEVILQLTSPVCLQSMNIIEAVKRSVGEIEGVESVVCRVDAEAQWLPSMMAESARTALRRRRPLDLAINASERRK